MAGLNWRNIVEISPKREIASLKVEKLEVIARDKATMTAAARGFLEMIESGAHDGTHWPFAETAHAVIVRAMEAEPKERVTSVWEPKDETIGLIAWRKDNDEVTPGAWISFAWVDPRYRRQGVYQRMFEALVEECRKLELVGIAGFVLAGNEAMQRTAAKVGRKALRTVYGVKL